MFTLFSEFIKKNLMIISIGRELTKKDTIYYTKAGIHNI